MTVQFQEAFRATIAGSPFWLCPTASDGVLWAGGRRPSWLPRACRTG